MTNMFEKKYQSKQNISKKAFLKGALIASIISLIILIAYQAFLIPYIVLRTNRQALQNLEKSKGKQIEIYVPTVTIKQGDIIKIENLKAVKKFQGDLSNDVIKSNLALKDKMARIDIPENANIIPSMITDENSAITADMRKQDFGQFKLNPGLSKGQFIDLRIRRKDGTDNIFASKKEVLDVSSGKAWLNITATERAYINAATVDASLTGSELYSTIYIDSQNQPAATVTYIIDSKIASQIDSNPSIVSNSAAKLEQSKDNTSQTTQVNQAK